MHDLYSMSYDAFIRFLNIMAERYQDNRKVLKHIIIDVLTKKNSIFNNELRVFLDEDVISLEVCKRCIMYILVSKSYIMNYYDYNHGINTIYSEEMLLELESLDASCIPDLFYKPTLTTDDIIEDFFSYIVRPYIFESKAKGLIIKDENLDVLFKLNPFEVLDIWDFIPDKYFTKTEEFIQTFFDLYDKALSHAFENGDAAECDDIDEFEFSEVLNAFYEHFDEDENKINQFISYLMSNVYEFLVIARKDGLNDYKHSFDLITYMEENSALELCNRFLNDYEFAFRIIDIFIEANDTLYEDDLLDKREDFKKCGDVKLLRKLNPYYDEEEKLYEIIKETSMTN